MEMKWLEEPSRELLCIWYVKEIVVFLGKGGLVAFVSPSSW